MSFKVAVLAREGRGGGDAIPDCFKEVIDGGEELDMDVAVGKTAAKGSWSTPRTVDGGVEGRECLRARGGGFWRELRARGVLPSTWDAFALRAATGGGGAGLDGWY